MLVYELKIVAVPSKLAAIDEAIRAGQFIRNKCLRHWMDASKEDKVNGFSLNKFTKVLADKPEFPSAAKLNSMARQARLSDLMAASSVADLPSAGRPHPLTGNRAGEFALDLVHPNRLMLEPAHNPIPRTEDGGIDWSRVTRVCIIWIGDYHD